MLESLQQNKGKLIITGVILAIIGLVGYSVFYVQVYAGKSEVEISLAPSDAALYVDNVRQQKHTLLLMPGKHTIKAEKEGYRTHITDITVTEGQEKQVIPISLAYESDDALVDSTNRRDEFLKNEGIAGAQAQLEGTKFREKNTIVQRLPYRTLLYTIGYQADPADPTGNSIIVTIDAPAGLRDDVVAEIERWGYDPTELNLMFRKYANPFEK